MESPQSSEQLFGGGRELKKENGNRCGEKADGAS